MTKKLKYKRILLKLSGELFGGKNNKGIDFQAYEEIAKKLLIIVKDTKVELAIVVGGGNIFRGREKDSKVDKAVADYMGMLSTVMNGMALQEAFERLGTPTRMMTAFEIQAVAEPYIRRRAMRHLEKGRVVILTAGIGSPYFTTDSGAALRAMEISCDALIKATNVDGAYSKDPTENPKAKLLRNLTYQEAIKRDLRVMDTTAFALCKEAKLPIIIFNIRDLPQLKNIIRGERIGTLISDKHGTS